MVLLLRLWRMTAGVDGVWEYRQPLPYPDVTLPHHWHLEPQRIPVLVVSQSRRAHDEEVRRRRTQLTPTQRGMPEYAADSPNWEAWFVLEHEKQRRRGGDANQSFLPPPPRVEPEEEEVEAEYQAALDEALQHALEASRLEEDTHWDELEQAIALSAARDSIHSPSLRLHRHPRQSRSRSQHPRASGHRRPPLGRRRPTRGPTSTASG